MSRPSIFLGSSVEQLDFTREIAVKLGYSAVVEIWDDIFPPGQTTLASLVGKAREVDFAAFIFAPDDQVLSRSEESMGPRDNVIFEAGLFGGILGMDRSIIVHASGAKLPSDLRGLTPISYDAEQPLSQCAGRAAHELKKVMERLGWKGRDSLGGQLAGDWWQLTLADGETEKSAVSFVTIEPEGPQVISLSGLAVTAEGRNHARFKSLAARLNEEEKTLFYYWEGYWPGEKRSAFFGKGEITLESAQRAHGSFTVRAFDDREMDERLETVYFRATPDEAKAMTGEEWPRRAEVVARQLQRREGLSFG